jgi:hypothetical protein
VAVGGLGVGDAGRRVAVAVGARLVGVGGTGVQATVCVGAMVGVSVGTTVAVAVAVCSGVGLHGSVGVAEGLGVLVGVGVTDGEGAIIESSGQVQLMVSIAATTASASTFLMSLFKGDVPFRGASYLGGTLHNPRGRSQPHMLSGVFEYDVLKLTRDVTANEVDGDRVRLGRWIVFTGHDVDQESERCVIHVEGEGSKPPSACRLS